ncbi:MAG: pantetheine-phosphate adenylyltransferase [Spirochaetia bacterium]|nr:pantetheine-phosphate adenylyltransferase [Spirochaetia bacterium]
MKNRVVYPGTFDPLTKGHIDIIKRAGKMFDEVIVAVAAGSHKEPVFSWDERVEMAKKVTKDFNFVKIDRFDGLLLDYLKKTKMRIVLRGLRAFSDFEYEFQIALVNKQLGGDNMESIFLMPAENDLYISSSSVKEIAFHGGDVSEFVHPYVAAKLKEKYR